MTDMDCEKILIDKVLGREPRKSKGIELVDELVKVPLADSGDRTEFGTGAQRDMGGEKGRCDLLPAKALLRMYESRRSKSSLDTHTVNCTFLHYLEGDQQFDHLVTIAWWAMMTMDDAGVIISDNFHERVPKLILPNALLRLARHYENGAKKYADRNWEMGLPISSFIDSGYRHFLKYVAGWTDEDHLAAVAWNVLGAMWTEEMYPELQDLPSRKDLEGIG